jgi:starvation-inducible DNA-binding protein
MKTNILGLPVKESELIGNELNILLSNFQVYYQNLRGIGISEENVFDLHVKLKSYTLTPRLKLRFTSQL